MNLIFASAFFALPPAGLFSCSRSRGTQEARVNTGCKSGPWLRSVARVWGVKVAKLVNNHRIAFRPSGANQNHANPENKSKFP